jgi:hypothetical protein
VRQFDPDTPAPVGSDNDYTALSLGSSYQAGLFTVTSRIEYRTDELQEKQGFMAGVYGEPVEGVGLSAAVRLLAVDRESGGRQDDSSVRFGLAWRPEGSRWVILDRLDIVSGGLTGGTGYDSRRVVNSLMADYRLGSRNELSVMYGTKYAIDTFGAREYTGLVSLLGIEHRFDITDRFDIGTRGSVAASSAGVRYGAGLSVGWQMLRDVWLSAGYNVAGFEDRDFYENEYTRHGPFFQFRTKIDQNTARAAFDLLGGTGLFGSARRGE